MLKDRLAGIAMAVGGVGVILAIVLIFFYLLYEVVPLFQDPSVQRVAEYSVPDAEAGKTLAFDMDEHASVAVRYTDRGELVFFSAADGRVLRKFSLPIAEGIGVTAFARGDMHTGVAAFGLSNGSVILVRHKFEIGFAGGRRSVTPALEVLLQQTPLQLFAKSPVRILAVQSYDDQTTVAGWTPGSSLSLIRVRAEESFLDDGTKYERSATSVNLLLKEIDYLLIDKDQRTLYAADRHGILLDYDINRLKSVKFRQQADVSGGASEVSSLSFLTGDISLMVGESDGRINQWFPVRNPDNTTELKRIRGFHEQNSAISGIVPEFSRKGFLAADVSGKIGIYHATAHRTLLVPQVFQDPIIHLGIGPRADAFLAEDRKRQVAYWHINNPHPEISWSALWGKVWYESYLQPDYIWQSSAANNDFEPKFSLTPLGFGTLKAAFYAMLVAIPIAILGAVYTAYFMAPALRRLIKPSIEIMEALPTVILGFLAGLWLAPALESHLPGFFLLLLILPLGALVFAYGWENLPPTVRRRIPDGWLPVLLIPVVVFLGWAAFAISLPLENLFFGGDFRAWLATEFGIPFDQRNSIIVGLAMGFAVIPTIFSITEDAVFSVPKHLTFGSLALGATPWQTMSRVVILTASPGIFSAVMIGLGRAVGETMIVLMATGNTPIMDFSLFQGMRTLAANIAVEMPESEVSSTHFRVLFLAALVLFAFTFVFNTIAELVRHRLRQRYSSL